MECGKIVTNRMGRDRRYRVGRYIDKQRDRDSEARQRHRWER